MPPRQVWTRQRAKACFLTLARLRACYCCFELALAAHIGIAHALEVHARGAAASAVETAIASCAKELPLEGGLDAPSGKAREESIPGFAIHPEYFPLKSPYSKNAAKM